MEQEQEIENLLYSPQQSSQTINKFGLNIKLQDEEISQQQRINEFRITKNRSQFLLSPQAQSLATAKSEKKLAEESLTVLQTRIQQLKLHDQKNQKQIREAKKKTFSLIQSKTRSFLDKQLLVYTKQQVAQLEAERQEMIRQQRSNERISLQARKIQAQEKREKELDFQKKMKQQIQDAIYMRRQQIENANLDSYKQIKTHEARLDERKRKIEQMKIQLAEKNYKEKVERELKEAMVSIINTNICLQQNTQLQLDLLEQQENMALQQLQKTQNLQQEALKEFTTLVRTPATNQSFRYKKKA